MIQNTFFNTNIEQFVRQTLEEDIGRGDLYSKITCATNQKASIIAKSNGVLAGVPYINALSIIDPFEIKWLKSDGDKFIVGEKLAICNGLSHSLLRIERTLLNILHHASSIANLTYQYVNLLKPYDVLLLDSRKTRPRLRCFEKYATRVGGGVNHRMGLDDALMLKDTHLKTITNLREFIKKARKKIPFTATIEVEAETFDMAKIAMRAGANIVMCDNMSCKEINDVVLFRNESHLNVRLEASGNITLKNIVNYAKTGVDAISVGATVHQAVWPDLSMKMD